MKYIIYRRNEIPEKASEFDAWLWYHLWRDREPLKELAEEDILYWYEKPSKSIVWKSRVVKLKRFPYHDKQELVQELVKRFPRHDIDKTEDYFVERMKHAPHGFCLAFEVKAIEKMKLQKPVIFRFLQGKLVKIDNNIAKLWDFPKGDPEFAGRKHS